MISFDAAGINAASLAHAAMLYAQAGIPVFPLVPGGKQPIIPQGFYRATTDLDHVARWWHTYPQANIGVACGAPSDWWVLDIDPRHGGWEALEHLQRESEQGAGPHSLSALLYTTRRQLTGGQGAHLVFRRRRDRITELRSTSHFAGYAGIDLKGDYGYVVVAPSLHPSGNRYQWLNDQPLAPFPKVLIERWIAHRQRSFASPLRVSTDRPASRSQDDQRRCRGSPAEPRFYLQYALSQASEGQRHRYALYLACRLVQECALEWEQAASWMREYVACVPQTGHPYTEQEALGALNWAFRQAY